MIDSTTNCPSATLKKKEGRLVLYYFFPALFSIKPGNVATCFLTGGGSPFADCYPSDWQAQGPFGISITELQKVMKEKGVQYIEATRIIETK